jgi:hypothetical protein
VLPTLSAFERAWKHNLLHEEIVELQREIARPVSIPDAQLSPNLNKAMTEQIAEDQRLLQSSWSDLQKLELQVLTEGRGDSAVSAGRAIVEAKKAVASTGANLVSAARRLHDSGVLTARELASLEVSLQSITSQASGAVVSLADAMVLVDKAKNIKVIKTPEAVLVATAGFDQLGPNAEAGSTFPLKPRPEGGVPPHSRPLSDYRKLSRAGDWTQFRRIVKDLYKAPGGVVIDARLRDASLTQIRQARVDISSGNLEVLMPSGWKQMSPALDAETARLAWAFASDSTIAAIYLRNLDDEEVMWLLGYVSRPQDLSNERANQLIRSLHGMTSVNLHPALVNTHVGLQMIAVDQLIFDMLPDADTWLNGEEFKYDLDLRPLKSRLQEDQHAALLNKSNWTMLFQKSILSITRASLHENEGGVRVEIGIDFDIYRLPARVGSVPPQLLKHSSAWFQENELTLVSHVPVLKDLVQFASAVTVMRSLRDAGVPNNFDELLAVRIQQRMTPRLICRPHGREVCNVELLR